MLAAVTRFLLYEVPHTRFKDRICFSFFNSSCKRHTLFLTEHLAWNQKRSLDETTFLYPPSKNIEMDHLRLKPNQLQHGRRVLPFQNSSGLII